MYAVYACTCVTREQGRGDGRKSEHKSNPPADKRSNRRPDSPLVSEGDVCCCTCRPKTRERKAKGWVETSLSRTSAHNIHSSETFPRAELVIPTTSLLTLQHHDERMRQAMDQLGRSQQIRSLARSRPLRPLSLRFCLVGSSSILLRGADAHQPELADVAGIYTNLCCTSTSVLGTFLVIRLSSRESTIHLQICLHFLSLPLGRARPSKGCQEQ